MRTPLRMALLSALISSCSTAALADELLQQAEQLLNQGKPADAWALLSAQEEARAGDAAFDYLLGLSALESGHRTNAAFALERCLETEPRNGPCRVQLARTYLALGETGNAKRETKTIQASNPPEMVQQVMDRYLGAITRQESEQKQSLTGSVEISAGHDSNANSGTSDKEIAIASLTLPTPNNAKFQDDVFSRAQANLNYRKKLDESWSVTASGQARGTWFQDLDTLNQTSYDYSAGVIYRAGAESLQIRILGQDFSLDNVAYRRTSGLHLQYVVTSENASQFTAYLQGLNLNYVSQNGLDADRGTAGIGYTRAFNGSLSPVVFGGLYGGKESNRQTDYQYYSHRFLGVRAGGQISVSSNTSVSLGVSHEKRDYEKDYALLGLDYARDDKYFDLSLSLSWHPMPALEVRPNYTLERNDSNIGLTDYKRQIGSVALRFDF